MDNRVAGCQPPAGATPLLRFGLPSPPGVVRMVMAPGSASGKHPFYVVCKCGLGCCVCGGRRVGVGVWGLGLLVVLHVCALFVGGGGWVWVKCPCGGFGSHPGCWVFGWCWCSRRVVWLSAAVVVVYYFALLFCSCVLLRGVVCPPHCTCVNWVVPMGGGGVRSVRGVPTHLVARACVGCDGSIGYMTRSTAGCPSRCLATASAAREAAATRGRMAASPWRKISQWSAPTKRPSALIQESTGAMQPATHTTVHPT